MSSIKLWPVDPLVQVFQDDEPPARKPKPFEVLAARNEYESAQFCLRSTKPLTNITARVVGLAGTKVNFVGFVPLTENSHETPDPEFIRKAPAMFPDPLLPPEMERLKRGTTLPVWVTVQVPKDKRPGTYAARVVVTCDQGTFEEPFVLRVMKPRVPDKRNLFIAHCFSANGPRFKKFHGVDDFGKKHWKILKFYADMMHEYRHNVILVNLDVHIDYKVGKNGKLAFDFKRFDKWVRFFEKAGICDRIQGGGMGSRDPWRAPEFDIYIKTVEKGKVVDAKGIPGSPEVEEYVNSFFPALERHLEKRGWLDIYYQELCGEPVPENAASYRRFAASVYKAAPRLRHMEPVHTNDLAGALDVWVPQLNNFHEDYDFYRERQKLGEELWFYTCCFPAETYPNRFIDYSLLKTRLLHWLNFRFGATGYLHWGLNRWRTDDPFNDMHSRLSPLVMLPPGDAWIVYPSEEHILLSSIRFEAMRDGIEDYELLLQLNKKNPKKAHALARRMIPKMTKPEQDVAKFRRARRELLEALSTRARAEL